MDERIQSAGNEFSARMRALNWGALLAAIVIAFVGLVLIASVNEIVGGVVLVAGLVVMWWGGWYSHHT